METYNNWNNMQNGNMPNNNKKMMTPQDKKRANGLCVLSLLLCYGPLVLSMLVSVISVIAGDIGLLDILNDNNTIGSVISVVLEGVQLACFIASIAIMIAVRVNYPASTFGKVIMWIYIVQIILMVIFAVIAIVACGVMLSSCMSGLRGCGEIGYLIGFIR